MKNKILSFVLAGILAAPLIAAENAPSYQPPKNQARAEIKWVKTICVEKDRYLGWPTVCRLASGDILTVFYQQPTLGAKPCLMATRWKAK